MASKKNSSPVSFVEIDGKKYRVKATLGALAEIQSTFNLRHITEIDKIFTGKVDANKMIAFMEILLRAGGNENSEEVAKNADMASFENLGDVFGSGNHPK